MKRKKYSKPIDIICKVCNQSISAYNISKHIQFRHNTSIDEYVNKFGEFRKNKKHTITYSRNIKRVTCQLCTNEYSMVGFHTHLRDSHNTSSAKYIDKFGEYRSKYINYLERSKLNSYQCLICNKSDFVSHVQFAHHIRLIHNLAMKDYVLGYIFNNNNPICECGCSLQVSLSNRPPYASKYISGHNPNGMLGRKHPTDVKNLMSIKAIEREYKGQGKYDTVPELKFKKWLKTYNINFKFQEPTQYGNIDFYLPDFNLYVEIDGDYWHPIKLENLTIQTLQSAINQLSRRGMSNLIRIRESHLDELNEIFCVEDLYKLNFEYDYSIGYNQIVVSKAYIQTLTTEKKEQVCILFLKLLRKLNIPFPIIASKYSIEYIIKKLNSTCKGITIDNTFSNNISTIGVSYLKSNFQSYWKSSYNKSNTPMEVWENDDLMYKILCWRAGINKNNETYNLSLHQIIRGISANRYNISFFKPSLAFNIYRHFLGDNKTPTVLDPCAGFGGRLLGFKSAYPNGKYIGIEPNIETYNELVKLSLNFNNIELYNCKIEDFKMINNYNIDLTFTSIPYYDLETYSTQINYTSIEHWKNTFLDCILKLPNLVLNIPNQLKELFPNYSNLYILRSNSSHFSKKQFKDELILKYF